MERHRDRWKEQDEQKRSEAHMERDEKERKMERWKGDFSLTVFGPYSLHFNLRYHPHANIASSLTLLFSLCHSFPVFICLSVIFAFCLFQQPLSLAFFPHPFSLSRVCEEGVNYVALNIGWVLSTPSHISARVSVCVFERERHRQKERERDAMKNDAVCLRLNQRCVFGPKR